MGNKVRKVISVLVFTNISTYHTHINIHSAAMHAKRNITAPFILFPYIF